MGLNSFQLKWIAIITMVIDHVGAILYPQEILFRVIGRIAFPIFCFLIVEGFFHTRDVGRYMLRLGGFALISEVPYDLAFRGKVLEMYNQNVFFTLVLGVFLMYLLEKSTQFPVRAGAILLVMVIAEILHTDYGSVGILLILLYYRFHERQKTGMCLGAVWNLLAGVSVQCFGVLATPFLALYNGQRGPKIKYFFYIFYPAHLLVLYAVKTGAILGI